MAYHTGLYLFLFLPAVLVLYQAMPKKVRWAILVLAGYLFFWLISGKLVIYLIGTTIFIHYIGIWLGWLKQGCHLKTESVSGEEAAAIKRQYKRRERRVLVIGIAVLLAMLVYLKYYNFFVENINFVLQAVGGSIPTKELLIPIGLSFYTLQAMGYLIDVYWERIHPEHDLRKLALFLSFFPQIMEGPISMYSQTAETLWKGNPLNKDNLSSGSVRILWGLFKKMIIADRLYVPVKEIFGNYENYGGLVVAVGAVAYTVQLYMEFSGCMDIVIGSGRLFGVLLPENFCQPFASRNAAEFWRRWHITLGVWFKTYVFYPVSVSALVKKWNKFGKKHLGTYITRLGVSAIALFPVWLCNGLWHGARWSYIFYGIYWFAILLCGIAFEPVRDRLLRACKINNNAFGWKLFQVARTWLIIFVGELFFRADGLRAGIRMFSSIFYSPGLKMPWDKMFINLGLDMGDYLAIIGGCVVVGLVGIIKRRKTLGERGLQALWLPARWICYYALIIAIIIFGAYGIGYQQVDLIYAEF